MSKTFIIKDTIPCYVTYIYRTQAENEEDALDEYYNSNATFTGHQIAETIGWLDHTAVEIEEQQP